MFTTVLKNATVFQGQRDPYCMYSACVLFIYNNYADYNKTLERFYDTLKVLQLQLPNCRTVTYAKRIFIYSSTKVWNKLGNEYKRDLDIVV